MTMSDFNTLDPYAGILEASALNHPEIQAMTMKMVEASAANDVVAFIAARIKRTELVNAILFSTIN